MSWFVVYPPIVGAVLSAVTFRRSWFVRIGCVIVLGIEAVFHMTFLIALHRLVLESTRLTTTGNRSETSQVDADVIITQVQQHAQRQIPCFLAIIAAFVFLSLLPFECDQNESNQPV